MNREYETRKPPRPPVEGFDIRFDWNPEWEALFDAQTTLIREHILEERARGNLVVYLSCPISNRGGGHFKTNVAIAEWARPRIEARFGLNVWVLNPAEYQMESVSGRNRIAKHARALDMDMTKFRPRGGDYMRMWTRVLASDENGFNQGDFFDAFYFLGPGDTHEFFVEQTGTRIVASAVEDYMDRRYSVDEEFHAYVEKGEHPGDTRTADQRRKDYLRFYTLRGGANYSKGCHDEWNIWVELNRERVFRTRREPNDEETDIGSQIAGYFDGRPIDPGSYKVKVDPGYAHVDYDVVRTTGDKRPAPD